mmetsp:Transcript_19588/g.24891  ORF Transcript_19588/g.24891 Transcript_19588/m.24891 type:complete len:308 (+) Transcript_19588:150-1073(+)
MELDPFVIFFLLLLFFFLLLPIFCCRPNLRLETPSRSILVRYRPIRICNRIRIQFGGILSSRCSHLSIENEQAHMNALGTQISGQRLRHHALGSLLWSKAHRKGFAPQRRGGSRHENRAAGAGARLGPFDHARSDLLGGAQQPIDVGLHCGVKLVEFDRVPCLPDSVSGIPHQNIDWSQIGFDGFDTLIDRFGLCDIAAKCLAVGNFGLGRHQFFQIARQNGNLVSFGGPLAGDRGPDFRSKSKDGTDLASGANVHRMVDLCCVCRVVIAAGERRNYSFATMDLFRRIVDREKIKNGSLVAQKARSS